MVTGFIVEWQREPSVGCSNKNAQKITVIGDFNIYMIKGLEPGNRYTITVKAFDNSGFSDMSNAITATTLKSGKENPIHGSLCQLLLSFSAPSSAPSSVRHSTITASSITLQWGEVPCLDCICFHHTGEITGYRMQALRNGVVETTANVSGGATREATISGLSPSTLYVVQVAAVNGAGIGPYSNGIPIRTRGKCIAINNLWDKRIS